jgi:hypothetical protein
MPIYRYMASDDQGQVINGVAETDSQDDLVRGLKERGFAVQEIYELPDEQTPAGDPVATVAESILRQALRVRAGTIVISTNRKGETTVALSSDDDRSRVMFLPGYVWSPLRKHLADAGGALCHDGDQPSLGMVHLRHDEHLHAFRLLVSPERVVLTHLPESEVLVS